MKQHQNTVLWQVNEKQEKQRQELLSKMEDERIARLKELQYQMRIEEERQKGHQLVRHFTRANF